ncbi:hypothetical protein AAEX28_04405 [Lentisphaerota bacterium WC36G]|nr:hypothetical protein LJT99_07270 [Lentisphaerae bacterium WC36]
MIKKCQKCKADLNIPERLLNESFDCPVCNKFNVAEQHLKKNKVEANSNPKVNQPDNSNIASCFGCLFFAGLLCWGLISCSKSCFKSSSTSSTSSSSSSSSSSSTSSTSSSSQFSAWNGSHYKTVKYVKNLLNDPKSFEHVGTSCFRKNGKNYIFMKYRAKNNFNATITSSIITEIDDNGNVIGSMFK